MMRPLEVAMHTTVGPRCGIADYTRALTAALVPRARVTTVPITEGRWSPLAMATAGRRLRGDVAHVQHTYGFFGVDQLTYTIAVRVLLGALAAPLVITAHTVRPRGPSRYAGGLGSALANTLGAPAWHDVETFRRARAVIVHAALHRDRLVERGVDAARCHIVPPGVPPRVAVTPAAVESFRVRHGLGRRGIVGVFGFIDRTKRIDLLLEALAGDAGPSAPVLLLAGGARVPEHEAGIAAIRALAVRSGLRDRLVITGYLEPAEAPVALEAMDVVVVPYGTEDSVSYSLHAALAQRRPVLATDVAPLRELAARGAGLALARRDDPHDLGKVLRGLLEDPPARRRLVEAAGDYAAAWGVAAAAARTLEHYGAAREAR
jgi:glycosyltransferase involved in cell wall biosynthesis